MLFLSTEVPVAFKLEEDGLLIILAEWLVAPTIFPSDIHVALMTTEPRLALL
ncbi:hypothetical protein BFZC1_16455 [Lysinibacillus fusiformis ZC1]|nr:hypothetical protein BFZC1_16455 [Lysinibacillus fusiformis ZC1]